MNRNFPNHNRTIKVRGFGSPFKLIKKNNNKSLIGNSHTVSTTYNANLFKSAVNFKLQLGRNQLKNYDTKGAHEARFSYLKPCTVLTSYHRPSSPDFRKMCPHNDDAMFVKNMTVIYYKPVQPAHLASLRVGCNVEVNSGSC